MGRIIEVDGKKLHVGGRLLPSRPHTFHLRDFNPNLAAWPDAPASTSYGTAPAAQQCLTAVLLNDRLGDCTQADKFHRQALRQAAAGAPVYTPSDDVVTAAYTRDGGMPGDNGCSEDTVMQNSVSLGDPCDAKGTLDKPVGYLIIDATNVNMVQRVSAACVGLAICMGLPDDWVNNMPSAPGWTWGVPSGGFVADPNNGHCFTFADYNTKNINMWSWGMPAFLTWDALAAGATVVGGGGLYLELSDEILAQASKLAPDGLDWAALQAALAAMTAPATSSKRRTLPPRA